MKIQNPTLVDSSGNEIETNSIGSFYGEVRMFALSTTGAITKASLINRGWAICDGTTPVSQGITLPTIETTPNLTNKFIRMSDDESSGSTGGSDSHTHTIAVSAGADTDGSGSDGTIDSVGGATAPGNDASWTGTGNTGSESTLPSYYELAFFIKVK